MNGEARIGRNFETGSPSRPERNESPGYGAGPGMSLGFVITLLSSTRPLDDVAARLPSAVFGTAFCEGHIVDGHAHYRLRLGPFLTMDSDAQALKIARKIFPRAVIRAADGIRCAGNRAVAHAEVPQAPRPARDDESGRTSESAGEATRPIAKGDSAVTTSEVIEIPDAQAPSKLYAVELLWSPNPLDLTYVPPLTLFDERTLYAVSVHRAGHPWYGLRVGFYRDCRFQLNAALPPSNRCTSSSNHFTLSLARRRQKALRIDPVSAPVRVRPLLHLCRKPGEPGSVLPTKYLLLARLAVRSAVIGPRCGSDRARSACATQCARRTPVALE